jgi:predicted peptidase
METDSVYLYRIGVLKMRKSIFLISVCLLLSGLSGCASESNTKNSVDTAMTTETEQADNMEETETKEGGALISKGTIPEKLEMIPDEYYEESPHPGTIEKLEYETYEAFSYEEQSQVLTKTAYVYLPYGYDETKQYPVFYLMHGGWSDETTLLGTPDAPTEFKFVLDHAVDDGKITPMIIVCPTYNNTSGKDSWDYSLAIELTDLYHQELVNDLIPAVEGKYSSYAESVSLDGIKESRDYRGFGGFSMGSVATWRTFEYCLDDFRYFMPMSGNAGNGSGQDNTVKKSDYGPEDFFIFTASGTEDFAYSAFKSQVMNMGTYYTDSFIFADNEADGNLSFRELEGGVHDYSYAIQYIYNGLQFFWSK